MLASMATAAALSLTAVSVPSTDGVTLPGKLALPDGKPKAAVVLLHGCSGLGAPQGHIRWWMSALRKEGVASVAVDSFTPRDVSTVCGKDPAQTEVSEVDERVDDALAAVGFLRTDPRIKAKRVAILGWSNGGSATLATMARRPKGVTGAVAFYPGCGLRGAVPALRPAARTSIFHAAKDPLQPACAKRKAARVDITTYTGAQHGFDRATTKAPWTAADRRARDAGRRAALKALRRALRLG